MDVILSGGGGVLFAGSFVKSVLMVVYMYVCFFFHFFPSQMFDCKNHIRVIQPMDSGNRLYICGTNAHNPKDLVIYVSITLNLLHFYGIFYFFTYFLQHFPHFQPTKVANMNFFSYR